MSLIRFLNSLWNNRFRIFHKKPSRVPEEAEGDCQIYQVDEKVRNHLIKKAFKETAEWKQGAAKRRMAWLLLFLPLVIYGATFAVMGLSGASWGAAAVDSAPVPLIAMVVLWPISIVMLKAQFHNAKIIPEDRLYDEITLTEENLIYTYSCTSDGFVYRLTATYGHITKLQHSSRRKTLYVFAKYQTSISEKGKQPKALSGKGVAADPFIAIPLYLKDSEAMVEKLAECCNIPVERIEEA